MKPEKLKYLMRDTDRHGNERYYVRAPGKRKVRLGYAPFTPAFMQQYQRIMREKAVQPLPETISLSYAEADVMYIYVISAAENVVKVGISLNPKARLSHLQIACPTKLKIEHVYAVNIHGAQHLERATHERLSGNLMRGEWFRVPASKAADAIECVSGIMRIEAKRVPQISK